MIPDILALSLGGVVMALVIAAILSPLETLSWWAGWTEQELDERAPRKRAPEESADRLYVVYLSGVASLSGNYLIARERIFVRRLRERFPDAAVIDTVFPYSPSGAPLLSSPRLFQGVWRSLQKLELEGKRSILKFLINIRNIYQVMVSADHRYGPIFSQGAANAIEAALRKAGLGKGGAHRIIIIGYSGGAQVAVGAAPFLRAKFDAHIDVISIGGVIASDPGLGAINNLYHFHGDEDRVEKVGPVIFPNRWPAFLNSHWNEALRQKRIHIKKVSGMTHAGPRGYFGLPKRDGKSNNERMAAEVAVLIEAAKQC